MAKIILIGGAPATGKTTLAKLLSKRLGCPFISADFIRKWMKELVKKEDCPELFHFTEITPEEYYTDHSIEETINNEYERDKEVWKGIEAFINKNREWETYIIEGISIHPEFVSSNSIDPRYKHKIIPLFLVDNNVERIKECVYSRGLWTDAKLYEDRVKDIEIEYLKETNHYYEKETKKYNFPGFLIEEQREKTIEKIIKYLNNNLS